jgi:hypothetical protein
MDQALSSNSPVKVEMARVTFDLVGSEQYLLCEIDCIYRHNGVSRMKTHIGKFEKRHSIIDAMIAIGNGDVAPPWSWPEKPEVVA